MKNLILLFLVFAAHGAAGQEITLTMKDSTTKEVKPVAATNTALFMSGYKIDYKDIAKANFKSDRRPDRDMHQKLVNAGVRVYINGQKKMLTPQIVPPSIVQEQVQKPITVNIKTEEDGGLKKFISNRNTGKVFQLLGVTALGVASMMTIKNNDAIKAGRMNDVKKIPSGLPAAGLGFMGIGLIIDIGASSHLKRLPRP